MPVRRASLITSPSAPARAVVWPRGWLKTDFVCAGGKVEDYDKPKNKTGVAIYHALLSHGVSTEWSEAPWGYFEQHNKF